MTSIDFRRSERGDSVAVVGLRHLQDHARCQQRVSASVKATEGNWALAERVVAQEPWELNLLAAKLGIWDLGIRANIAICPSCTTDIYEHVVSCSSHRRRQF